MNHVRRKGTIVMATKAQYMLDHYFGIDMMTPTAAGKLYNKNGLWGTGDGRTEQCVAFFMPQNMELALFVNSPIGLSKFSLRNLVRDAGLELAALSVRGIGDDNDYERVMINSAQGFARNSPVVQERAVHALDASWREPGPRA